MKKLKYLSFINMAGVLRKSIKSVKRLSGVISTNIINVTNIINGDGSYCDIGDFELPDKTVDEILKLKDDGFIPSADDLENTMIQIIRATCREIRTNVIPAILAQYYTPENLPTLIRYLNEMLKDKYQFNHNIRKIIFGLSQGKNEQDSYDERTYKKAKQKFEKLKSQPPKEFNKFIKEALPELLRKDLIFISRLLIVPFKVLISPLSILISIVLVDFFNCASNCLNRFCDFCNSACISLISIPILTSKPTFSAIIF